MKANKAQNLAIVGGVLGIIVVAVMLLVGNIVYQSIRDSLAGQLSGAGLAIEGNITANVNSAFQLASVTPIVQGAALILTVIIGFAAVVAVSSRN